MYSNKFFEVEFVGNYWNLSMQAKEGIENTISFLKQSPHLSEGDEGKEVLHSIAKIIETNDLAVSYNPYNRKFTCHFENGTTREYRPSKFVRKLLSITGTINGRNWEYFQNRIERLFPKMGNYEVRILEDAAEMYAKDFGIISCMTGDKEGLAFYQLAPVKGVVVYYGDKPMARALLWQMSEGKTFLDRIYATDTYAEKLMKEWAEANCDFQEYNWNAEARNYHVSMPQFAYEEANAYLDTMDHMLICPDDIKLFVDDVAAMNWKKKHSHVIPCSRKPIGMTGLPDLKKDWEDMRIINGHYMPKSSVVEYKGEYYWEDEVPFADPTNIIKGNITHGVYRSANYANGEFEPMVVENCIVLKCDSYYTYMMYDIVKGTTDELIALMAEDPTCEIVKGQDLLGVYIGKGA